MKTNERPGDDINVHPAQNQDQLPPQSTVPRARRHGPFPDRPLRAFTGWPEGLSSFLSMGTVVSFADGRARVRQRLDLALAEEAAGDQESGGRSRGERHGARS